MPETENRIDRTREPSIGELSAQLDGVREVSVRDNQAVRDLLTLQVIRLEGEITALTKATELQFKAAESKVDAAFAAQEKVTSTAFTSSEKAVSKAEDAQKEYNIRSNEFRGQLDDQAKMLMPRAEVQTLFKASDEKVNALTEVSTKNREHIDSSITGLRTELMREIAGLRESRSEYSGRNEAKEKAEKHWNWGVGIAVAILLGLISLGVQLLQSVR